MKVFEFHNKLKKHFATRKKTWDWFSKKEVKENQKKEWKNTILKNSLRLDPADYPALYDMSADICSQLAIDPKVTLYQESNSIQTNTSVCIIDNEAHIVFSGNVLILLNDEEKKALLGHELGHYLFSKMDSESYEITERIINALALDNRSDDAYIETQRKFRLYLELFCDMCSLKVSTDHKAIISTLMKLETGLPEVNAESYLKQALEIIAEDESSSEEVSHPESYIRSLWVAKKGSFQSEYEKIEVEELVEGKLDMNKLDLFEQTTLKEITLRIIQLIIQPKWMRTEEIMNLAFKYFPEISGERKEVNTEELSQQLKNVHINVKNYLSYVLLDFSQVDDEMDVIPLGHTLEISEILDFTAIYEKVIKKELKLNSKEFKIITSKILEDFKSVREDKNQSLHN